ncbi:MAG: diguanylate cyclase [Magnetococcales bacterium]|nr:diguanylate cyclase [Magnetococcales bacterium]
MFNNSLGQKILVIVGVVTLFNLVGLMVFYTKFQEKTILDNHRQNMDNLTDYVSRGLQSIMLSGTAEIAKDFEENLVEGKLILDFHIIRNDGSEAFQDNQTITEVNNNLGEEEFLPRDVESFKRVLDKDDPLLKEVISSKKTISYFSKLDNSDVETLTFLTPIPNEKKCRRCHGAYDKIRGVLKLTTSLESVQNAIMDTRSKALKILFLSVILSLTGIYVLIRVIVVKPVQSITSAISNVSNGNYGQSIPVTKHDELSVMARQFNMMSSEIKKSHDGLNKERNKLSTIILSAREGIIVTNEDDEVVLVNPAAERLLNKSSDKLIADGFDQIIDDPNYVTAYLETNGKNMPDSLVYNHLVIQFHAETIFDRQNKKIGSAAMIRDVTEQKQLEDQLREMSFKDKLTGIFNRRGMEDILNKEFSRSIRYNQDLSLIFFDVDHFKKFNDTHGHDLGDKVLARLGSEAISHFRKPDFPCRYGGEEFCIILTNTNSEGAYLVAEKFRQRVENMNVDGLKVTISIGVSAHPEAGAKSPEELLKLADEALYEGKRSGRNRVVLWRDVKND